MGLDMYLHKVKKEEVAYWRKANAIHAWFNRLYAENHDGEDLDNCQPLYVAKENLIKLKEDCKKVIGSSKLTYKNVLVEKYDFEKKDFVKVEQPMLVLEDTSVAEKLLPTKSGFFFGSTVYGELYLKELVDTIEQVNKILEEVNFDEYGIEYYAWW